MALVLQGTLISLASTDPTTTALTPTTFSHAQHTLQISLLCYCSELCLTNWFFFPSISLDVSVAHTYTQTDTRFPCDFCPSLPSFRRSINSHLYRERREAKPKGGREGGPRCPSPHLSPLPCLPSERQWRDVHSLRQRQPPKTACTATPHGGRGARAATRPSRREALREQRQHLLTGREGVVHRHPLLAARAALSRAQC